MQDDRLPPEQRYLPPPDGRSGAVSVHSGYSLGELRAPGPDFDDDEIDLRDLWRMVMAHKGLLITMALVGLLTALLVSFIRTPIYQATTTLQVDKRAAPVVRFAQDMENVPELDDRTGMGTQLELLKSRVLAERVIDELNLDRAGLRGTPAASHGTLLPDDAAGTTGDAGAFDGLNAEQEPGFWEELIERLQENWQKIREPSLSNMQALDHQTLVNAFQKTVHVEQVRNSRMIQVSVDNPDPRLAARIANTTADSFIALNLERRLEASSYAKSFLDEQLALTKAKLEESERRLNAYAREHDILTLDDNKNAVNQTFVEYASALVKAEQERIKFEAEYQSIQSAPNTAVQVLSNTTIQAYKEQRAKLAAEYQEKSKIYKDNYPAMLQLRAQMQDLDSKIQAEISSILRSVGNQLNAARQQEAQIRAQLEKSRGVITAGRDSEVDYNLLRREVDTNRELYDGLLQQVKEVGVAGGVETNNIQVVDKAQVPLYPYKPKIPLNSAIGLLAGLMLGLMLVFLRETLDDSIKSAEDLEKHFGLPLLGVIPSVKLKSGETALAFRVQGDPRGQLAEAYRSLRTALQFSSATGAPRRMAITSTTVGEGKSTTAVALALNFAQLGGKVALIDADMRNPVVHKRFELDNSKGLSTYLSGQNVKGILVRSPQIENLAVITSGPVPPNPVELLAGPRFAELMASLEEAGYSHVVVDGPPVLGLADAVVLGNHMPLLYVAQAGSTRISHIKTALQRLGMAGAVPLGFVLTKTTSQTTSYYADKSYYGYGGNEMVPVLQEEAALARSAA